ncbi:hypothetical protein [Alkalihalobacillus sp. AL-G]|uniref:hypothetical protein n=1 Tax=Alkalihalobacillus sp. AL-G TaxID=2926399 RepID=UPI00272CE993|nr:hypothetical protein [Alkalihalobacillus sp. AL-G]WLD94388.1 hypothetical protein MOJ78_05740 [Alkalihalobacillus sp. AL-G]
MVINIVLSLIFGGFGGFIFGAMLFSDSPKSEELVGYTTLFGIFCGLFILLLIEIHKIGECLKGKSNSQE